MKAVQVGLLPIFEALIKDHAPKEYIDTMLENLTIRDVTYRINYSDESKDRVVDESNIDDFDPYSFHPQDFFQKETSFSYEQEIRTVWLPITKNPMTGNDMPINLPASWDYRDLCLGRLPIFPDLHENMVAIKTSPLKPKGK